MQRLHDRRRRRAALPMMCIAICAAALVMPVAGRAKDVSPADAQVNAIFGNGALELGTVDCPAGNLDLSSISESCVRTYFGLDADAPFFRTDIGVFGSALNVSGGLPPSGETPHDCGCGAALCGGFFMVGGQTLVTCSVYAIPEPLITAADQTANAQAKTSVTIDLTQGYLGALPTGANLVGAVSDGTVSGFPSTQVVFTPSDPFDKPGQFQFTLTSGFGTSNVATVTVLPALFSLQVKAEALALQDAFRQVSGAFDIAATALEGPDAVRQNLAASVAADVGYKATSLNDQIYQQTGELSVGVIGLAISALKAKSLRGKLALPLAADALAFKAFGLGALLVAADPPDNDYQTVDPPAQLAFRPTHNSVVDQAIADYLNYFSLRVAVLHAAERWQGALLAGDKASEKLQKNAFDEYTQAAKAAKKPLNDDNASLAAVLQPVDINTYPGGAAALADAYHSLCGENLPESLNHQLRAMGLAQKTIDRMVCDDVNPIGAGDLTTDFRTFLTTRLP